MERLMNDYELMEYKSKGWLLFCPVFANVEGFMAYTLPRNWIFAPLFWLSNKLCALVCGESNTILLSITKTRDYPYAISLVYLEEGPDV